MPASAKRKRRSRNSGAALLSHAAVSFERSEKLLAATRSSRGSCLGYPSAPALQPPQSSRASLYCQARQQVGALFSVGNTVVKRRNCSLENLLGQDAPEIYLPKAGSLEDSSAASITPCCLFSQLMDLRTFRPSRRIT